MRILLLLIISLIVFVNGYAQKHNRQDAVYLKNGSMIRGEVMKEEGNKINLDIKGKIF